MKVKKNKILILTGGESKYLLPFKDAANELDLDVTLASFLDLTYETTTDRNVILRIGDKDVASFDVIYIRLIYKCFEEASLLVEYARNHKIKIVDEVYEKARFTRLPIAKSLESKILHEAGIPFPKTVFGRVKSIRKVVKDLFSNGYVIKDSSGRQGRDIWSPTNDLELEEVLKVISVKEREECKRYLIQELIESDQRIRVLVVGGKAIAAMTRPAKWRERFVEKVNGQVPPPVRKEIKPIPEEDANLAIKAAKVLSIDIAGVDILHQSKTDKQFVLEVNSAPRWSSIKRYTAINVEKEILRYLERK